MTDPHLNLFYSYNQDSELIENNLTRAFIVTLRYLTPIVRHTLLDTLLKEPLQNLGQTGYSFHKTTMALQGHVNQKQIQALPNRYILALASDRIAMAEEDNGQNQSQNIYASIPDGWIINEQEGWCFLIEAKVGSNPINSQQIISHAFTWLNHEYIEFTKHLISLQWVDVLSAIEKVERAFKDDELSQQEKMLLSEFKNFISFYGYRKFEGLTWNGLASSPNFWIRKKHTQEIIPHTFLGFSELQEPPNIRIKV